MADGPELNRDDQTTSPPRPDAGSTSPTRPRLRADSIFPTLISAGLFLYVGFGVTFAEFADSDLYNRSVVAFSLGAKVLGIALLVVAGLTLIRSPLAAWADLAVTIVASLGCLVIGAIWIMNDFSTGYLLVLLGLWNGYAARGAVAAVRRPPHDS